VDDFDFVLALDSSGSFGVGGDPFSTQKKAVLEAVPEFIKEIRNNSEYSANSFKISVVGWNDQIDFAYGDFNNRNPRNAKLVPVENVTSDIGELEEHYICDEESFTNISIPISAALNILDEKINPPDPNKRTSRFVILVTGRSEFSKAQENLIKKAREKNYPIYIIGLDIVKGSKLHDHLMELGDNKQKRVSFISFIPSQSKVLAGQLRAALEAHLFNATREPIARNVTIDETVYPYIMPDLKSIRIKGNTLGANSSIVTNTDKTKTIHIELADGLMPRTETEITLEADLQVNLPVTFSEATTPISKQNYQPHSSQMKMKYLNENNFKMRDLPMNNINFGSVSSESVDSSEHTGASSESSSESPIPQIDLLFSLLKSLGNTISVIGAIGTR
jgi:hypothetical protein